MTRRVDDEVVILDIASGRYFSLDGVGAMVWECLERETTSDELVDAVVTAFDVDRGIAVTDIDELVAELATRNLIER